MRNYLTDFARGWRPLLAATFGLSGGMSAGPFVTAIFSPHLVATMGWSKPAFAALGSISGLSILVFPIVGRLADRFGTRRLATVGVCASILSYVLLSRLHGSMGFYAAILLLQTIFGATTAGPVYLRPIVQNFTRTRGVALAIAVSGPAIVALFTSPILSRFIVEQGWRTGYLVMAVYAAILGGLALMLVPPERVPEPVTAEAAAAAPVEQANKGFRPLLSNRVFLRLIGIAFLVSLPIVITNAQLGLLLVWKGLTPLEAGSIISIFAGGVIVGRLAVGAALDRFEAETVGAISFSLPVIGMLLLASPLDHIAIILLAVLLVGWAIGAEGDLLTYIVVKHVGLGVYSTGLGMIFSAFGMVSLFGGLGLSLSLRLSGGYMPFLVGAACLTLVGCILLYRVGRNHPSVRSAPLAGRQNPTS